MYENAQWSIRNDLADAHKHALTRLSEPGSWWNGEQRIAIAASTRDSRQCSACETRLSSLSTSGDFGEHTHAEGLSDNIRDVVHVVATDASRLTQGVVGSITAEVMSVGHYVELIGIVATVTAIDRFCLTLNMAIPELPQAKPGEPDNYLPQCATSDLAWVPTIAPEQASGPESGIYRNQSAAHIHRALSLVPAEKHGFFELDDVMYLKDAQLRNFDHEYRAINHAQIELVAARVSALNHCIY